MSDRSNQIPCCSHHCRTPGPRARKNWGANIIMKEWMACRLPVNELRIFYICLCFFFFFGYKVLLSINMPTFGLNQYERNACLDGYAYSLYHFHQATVNMSIRIRKLNFIQLPKRFPDQELPERLCCILGFPTVEHPMAHLRLYAYSRRRL